MPGLAWLDGGLEHGREGRYSFVSTAPCEVRDRAHGSNNPLSLLAELARAEEPDAAAREGALSPEDVPHWIGHVAYDAALLPGSHHAGGDRAAPCIRFARYEAWYVFDHQEGAAYLVGDDEQAGARLARRLQAAPVTPAALGYASGALEVTARARHQRAVEEALALIREGEVYEINLARRYRAPFSGSPLGLFLRMRVESPVPLGYFVDGGDHAVLGRSMERFLRYRTSDRSLTTSPIKGTVARLGDDLAEAARLRADPKEHAEHCMVVDLMRNDLSRVCEVGSVEVSDLLSVLPFAGLSHLISTVRGRVRAGVDLHTLLAEAFPPGSVTGTPKERVLRAIDALEDVPRGVYTGCMGFVDRTGGCSLAVAIRTAVIARGEVSYFAGGGIVADSDPTRETDETELKAERFVRALEAARLRDCQP